MKHKVIIASHRKFAEGLKDTLEYIVPGTVEISAISAYLTNIPIKEEINRILKDITENDEVIVFTDMLGGSVNQAFTGYLAHPHFHIITGMNLPVLMSVILSLTEDYITADTIRSAVSEAQEQLIYVNDFIANKTIGEEDE